MTQCRMNRGTTVTLVLRKRRCSNRRRKHRRKRFVRVTPVNRDSTSRMKMTRLVEQNDNKHSYQEQKSSDDLALKDKTIISIPFDQDESKTLSHIQTHPTGLDMVGIPSVNETNTIPPRLFTSSKNKGHTNLATSSFIKSFASFGNSDTSVNVPRIKTCGEHHKQQPNLKNRLYTTIVIETESKKLAKNIEENKTNKKKRRKRLCKICPQCSHCCCLASIIGTLLFLIGLAALLVFIFTTKHITTTVTTTTSTTATTSTTSTTTTTTSTTSTTSTTTTSTSTSSTTSTTSVTTTTTTTTSSTSTSSTSTTSITTTTTTRTTSTSTTTTTPAPPCIPNSVGSASTLYSISSGSGTSYTCFAYAWTSPTSSLVTLAFHLRHDPSFWYLDEVSVYAGGTQMLINGNFESGSLSPWVLTIPSGGCGGSPGQVSATSPQNGARGFSDGSNGCADQVAQQFMATAGQIYVVSFWLKSGSTGSIISALVTLS